VLSHVSFINIYILTDQQVFSLAPFTGRDLATRSLSDRINDINHLHYLYPDIPKGTAFSKYYTPVPDTQTTCPKGGYVKPILRTTIPG